MKALLLTVILASIPSAALVAQTPQPSPTDTPPSAPWIWKCTLPGGMYEVDVRKIVSVSMHAYIANGVAQVNEVNIDTTGNAIVRFYFLEPLTPNSPVGFGQSAIDKAKELLDTAAERTGQQEVWKQVVKDYPTSTHAHTIEYRVETQDQLNSIFSSAEMAFNTGKGGAPLKIP